MRHVPHASPPATAALRRRGLRGRPGVPRSGLWPRHRLLSKTEEARLCSRATKTPFRDFLRPLRTTLPCGAIPFAALPQRAHGKASAAPYGRSRLGISGVCDARLRPRPIGLRSGRTYAKRVRVCVCPRTERTRAADRPRQATNGSRKPSGFASLPVKCSSCRIRQGRASSHCRNIPEV